jgi:hypothetical protein
MTRRTTSIVALGLALVALFASVAKADGLPTGVLVPGRLADALGTGGLVAVAQPSDPTARAAYQIDSVTDPRFAGAQFPAGSVVMYDLEPWPASSAAERADPQAALQTFVSQAHADGYVAIIAPAWRMVGYTTEGCSRMVGETRWAAYLRCLASVPADGLLVQAQYFQCGSWAGRVKSAAAVQPGRTWGEVSLQIAPDKSAGACINGAWIDSLVGSLGGSASLSMWGLEGWPTARADCTTIDIRCEADQIAIGSDAMAGLP